MHYSDGAPRGMEGRSSPSNHYTAKRIFFQIEICSFQLHILVLLHAFIKKKTVCTETMKHIFSTVMLVIVAKTFIIRLDVVRLYESLYQ